MADRRLILLRHGQTAWNAERRAQGHSDVELDETGHRQAAHVAPVLAALEPAFVWSSDLARSRQTAEYVAKETGLDLRLDERLREYHLGERTGLTMAEYAAAHPEEYRAFRAGRYDVVPGGETTADVVARMSECLSDALAAVTPGECGVVVGHGGALKVTLVALFGWPEKSAGGLQALVNCGWAEVADSGVEGRLRLAAYNVTAPGPPDFVSRTGVG